MHQVTYPSYEELLFSLDLLGHSFLIAQKSVGVLLKAVHTSHQQLHVLHQQLAV